MSASIREVCAYGATDGWQPQEAGGAPPVDPAAAARASRAEADTRRAAFAVNGDDPRDGTQLDFDHGPVKRMPDPIVFQKQEGDADAVDARDVRQGQLGDCYVLAPLAAMAASAEGRALLRRSIVANSDANGDVTSFTVTLHEVRAPLFGRATSRDVPVTVDASFLRLGALIRGGLGGREVWPLLVEKACAAVFGGYNRLDRGGSAGDAIALLTGRPAATYPLSAPARWLQPYPESKMCADLAAGKIVVLSSRGAESAPSVAPAHAYFVVGVEQHDGRSFVRLGDPLPDEPPTLVPFDELAAHFTTIQVGAFR